MGSFVIPYFLASLNLLLGENPYQFHYGPIGNSVFRLILFIFAPFFLIIGESHAKLKLQFCKKDDIGKCTDKYKIIKNATCSAIRTELGCETTIQMFLGLLLLIYSMSATRISETISIFDKRQDNAKLSATVGIPPETFIIAANVWSLFSGWRSFICGMKSSKDRFPLKSQLVLLVHVGLSMISKVVACLLFLTPCLGLFDCLRHYQGLLMPYEIVTLSSNNPQRYGHVNVSTDFVSYSDVTFSWAQLSPYDYSNPSSPKKPEITIFTVFDAKEILYLFWFLFVIQAFLILGAKRITNPNVFKNLHWLQKITHSLENVWIPAPMQDWDHVHSTLDEYKKKRRKISLEIAVTIGVNFLQNVAMLTPIWIFAHKVNERHQFLVDTIGPLPEEIDAHWNINFVSYYMVLIFFGGALLQFLFYWFYNSLCHPFQVLMKDQGKKITSISQTF